MLTLDVLSSVPPIGLAGIIVYIFLFKNPHKKFVFPIVIFSVLWILSFMALRTLINGPGYLPEMLIAFAAGFYLLRFIARPGKRTIDYIKALLVVALAFYEWYDPYYQSFIGFSLIVLFALERIMNEDLEVRLKRVIAVFFGCSIVVALMRWGVEIKDHEETLDNYFALDEKLGQQNKNLLNENLELKIRNKELNQALSECLE